jgi:hypothetical protein
MRRGNFFSLLITSLLLFIAANGAVNTADIEMVEMDPSEIDSELVTSLTGQISDKRRTTVVQNPDQANPPPVVDVTTLPLSAKEETELRCLRILIPTLAAIVVIMAIAIIVIDLRGVIYC